MSDASLSSWPTAHSNEARPARTPVSVQLLSTLLFGAFAITAVALAFVHFWPAGILLAVLLGWRGGFVPQSFGPGHAAEIAETVRSLAPESRKRASGNASFDSYRSDMLKRLEGEQESFETFLERLRSASDKHEFDQFMDDRAEAARLARLETAKDPDEKA